jgi:hypothetical protein
VFDGRAAAGKDHRPRPGQRPKVVVAGVAKARAPTAPRTEKAPKAHPLARRGKAKAKAKGGKGKGTRGRGKGYGK